MVVQSVHLKAPFLAIKVFWNQMKLRTCTLNYRFLTNKGMYFYRHFTIMIEVKNKIHYYFFQFYCLPDNYEVIDSSLDDIKVSLNFNN